MCQALHEAGGGVGMQALGYKGSDSWNSGAQKTGSCPSGGRASRRRRSCSTLKSRGRRGLTGPWPVTRKGWSIYSDSSTRTEFMGGRNGHWTGKNNSKADCSPSSLLSFSGLSLAALPGIWTWNLPSSLFPCLSGLQAQAGLFFVPILLNLGKKWITQIITSIPYT